MNCENLIIVLLYYAEIDSLMNNGLNRCNLMFSLYTSNFYFYSCHLLLSQIIPIHLHTLPGVTHLLLSHPISNISYVGTTLL